MVMLDTKMTCGWTVRENPLQRTDQKQVHEQVAEHMHLSHIKQIVGVSKHRHLKAVKTFFLCD